jgi:hypothetical protein
MLCSSSTSICLPSTQPAPPFRSSLAPPDARRAAWFSSAAVPPNSSLVTEVSRQRRRPLRPGPWPYRLTLLRRSDRPGTAAAASSSQTHRASAPLHTRAAWPSFAASRFRRPPRMQSRPQPIAAPPGPGPSPPSPPTPDFLLPSHLPRP